MELAERHVASDLLLPDRAGSPLCSMGRGLGMGGHHLHWPSGHSSGDRSAKLSHLQDGAALCLG